MLGFMCFGFCHVWEKSGSSCLLSMDYLAVFHSFLAVLCVCVCVFFFFFGACLATCILDFIFHTSLIFE